MYHGQSKSENRVNCTQTCTYYRSKIADDWQRNEQFPDYMYLISDLIFCRYQFLFYIQRKQYLNALQR